MNGCQNLLGDFEFPLEDIEAAVRQRRLLSMEIEFSRQCNFRCPYCYVDDIPSISDEMSPEQIRDVLVQAKALGARRIIVLGGEPMVYPRIFEMLDFIGELGMEVELFTNGTRMDRDAARFLFERNVKVVLKMNTRDPELQDILSGFKGAHDIIQSALHNLGEVGYPGEGKILAISSIICRHNADELVDLWRWLRDRNIEPYFEMLTPQGRADRNENLQIDSEQAREIFERIAEVDRTEYGRQWDPQPPLVGNRCLRHQFSVLVNACGDVLPCVGVTIPVGNVRKRKLKEIIEDSEVMQDLRGYRRTITGPCARCDKAETCYGCRGAAYQLTGDYKASDPLCWRNQGWNVREAALPAAADRFLPQKDPMRVVDRLLSVGERSAVLDLTVPSNSPFVSADGILDESAFMEIMAQGMAALEGFRAPPTNGNGIKGFLLGARELEITGVARAGDQLEVSVFKEAKLGDFGIVRGTVSRNGETLAQGEIKVWHEGAADRTGAEQWK